MFGANTLQIVVTDGRVGRGEDRGQDADVEDAVEIVNRIDRPRARGGSV